MYLEGQKSIVGCIQELIMHNSLDNANIKITINGIYLSV